MAEKVAVADDEKQEENLRCQYDHALQIAHHSDGIIHEVTAIVWGANTLLLGFILEVPCTSKNQRLVVVAAVVGFILSVYVLVIHILVKKGQRIAYQACRDIEDRLKLDLKLHHSIHEAYPGWKPGWKAVGVLSIVFILSWFCVGYSAIDCLCKR